MGTYSSVCNFDLHIHCKRVVKSGDTGCARIRVASLPRPRLSGVSSPFLTVSSSSAARFATFAGLVCPAHSELASAQLPSLRSSTCLFMLGNNCTSILSDSASLRTVRALITPVLVPQMFVTFVDSVQVDLVAQGFFQFASLWSWLLAQQCPRRICRAASQNDELPKELLNVDVGSWWCT